MTKPTPAARMPDDFLPYGAVYVLHHGYDAAKIRTDIESMAALGLNTVMLWPAIEWDAKAEAPDWRRIDVAIETMERTGLKCIPELIGEVHWMEFAPSFKTRGREDIWVVPSRMTARGRFGEEGPNLNHPVVREMLDQFMSHIAERYAASDCLYAYNIWDEPFFSSEDDVTLGLFRDWLREKYGTLDELNRLYGRTWSRWREVVPTQFSWFSTMPRIDWELFRLANTNDILRFLVETMRKYDADTPILTHPVGEQLHKPGRPMMDGWDAAKAVDIYGLSFYHKDEDRPEDDAPWHHASVFDAVRCAAGEKPAILAECQSNHRCETSLFGYMDGPEVEFLSWQSFAHGCKGVLFWKWLPFLHGQQNLGRGLCRTDGSYTDRAVAAGKVARTLAAHRELFAAARPVPAQAGILFSPTDEAKGRMLSPPGLDETKPGGGAWLGNHHRKSCTGVYRALWDHNIPADYLNCDYVTAEQLSRYRLLFAPFLRLVDMELADALADWVRKGGTLVADARFAVSSRLDLSYPVSPPGALGEAFGGRRLEYTASAQPQVIVIEQGIDALGLGELPGMYFRESWELGRDVEVLGRFDDGQPALMRHGCGDGTVFFAATCLPAAMHSVPNGPVQQAILALTAQADVGAPADVDDGPGLLSVRLMHTDEQTILFVFNRTPEPQQRKLLLVEVPGRKALTWIEGAGHEQPTSVDGAGTLEVQLPPRGVLIATL